MHELSVTQAIVDACCERAGDTRVQRVTLEIGTLSCVLPESLRFCYDVAIMDTPLEHSELEIIRIPGHSTCNVCGSEVEMQDMLSVCPCGSANLSASRGGQQLKIKSMLIEETA